MEKLIENNGSEIFRWFKPGRVESMLDDRIKIHWNYNIWSEYNEVKFNGSNVNA